MAGRLEGGGGFLFSVFVAFQTFLLQGLACWFVLFLLLLRVFLLIAYVCCFVLLQDPCL